MPYNVRIDDKELIQLSVELGAMGKRVDGPVRDAFREGAKDLRDEWRKNARASSGRHARKYPGTISFREYQSRDLNFEVGPLRSAKGRGLQGDLGSVLEFGSAQNPPHLDGQKAADAVLPRLERRILLAAEDVFGSA